MFASIISVFLHIDVELANIIQMYGVGTYALLFFVIFIETGLVVTPFLPGDSLLFAAGAFAARGSLNVALLFVLLFVAAVLGDGVNYAIGKRLGHKVFEKESRWFKKEHVEKTHAFYEKHGGKAIVFARFVPIVRTFAPFVAGVGQMQYLQFVRYNIVGAFLWVALLLGGGYFFGNLPVVRDNFTAVIYGIVIVSVAPGIIRYAQTVLKKRSA